LEGTGKEVRNGSNFGGGGKRGRDGRRESTTKEKMLGFRLELTCHKAGRKTKKVARSPENRKNMTPSLKL